MTSRPTPAPRSSSVREGEHLNTIYPQDGENCRYCGAWSDAEWSAPCSASTERRAEVDRGYAEREAEL